MTTFKMLNSEIMDSSLIEKKIEDKLRPLIESREKAIKINKITTILLEMYNLTENEKRISHRKYNSIKKIIYSVAGGGGSFSAMCAVIGIALTASGILTVLGIPLAGTGIATTVITSLVVKVLNKLKLKYDRLYKDSCNHLVDLKQWKEKSFEDGVINYEEFECLVAKHELYLKNKKKVSHNSVITFEDVTQTMDSTKKNGFKLSDEKIELLVNKLNLLIDSKEAKK